MRIPPYLEDARAEEETLVVRVRGDQEYIPRVADRMWYQSRVASESIGKQEVENKGDEKENHPDGQHDGGLLPRSAAAQMPCKSCKPEQSRGHDAVLCRTSGHVFYLCRVR